jgi:chromate reductase, NAD(P)H dehydrogenase (quinone)
MKERITVISATNREDSYTEAVAGLYTEILRDKGYQADLFSLRELPEDVAFAELYGRRSDTMKRLLEKYVADVNKFVFVVPEYNGSFPGILKVFLDSVSPRQWHNKKAGIIGVSSGHSGNLRGQDHLTGVLHYLRMFVHYNKPKLSGIGDLTDDRRRLVDAATLRKLDEHAVAIGEW